MFRSVLCFWMGGAGGRSLLHAAGPAGIEAYLDDPLESRLIMSMKTYLAQRSFTRTQVHGRPFTLEAMVALFLRALLDGVDLGGARIVAGRPVRFAGELADDTLGEARLRESYRAAEVGEVEVAFEPEAAGYRFARTLDGPATVLIGDFGGGTSDFSVLRFAPGTAQPVTALATTGVGVAGDTFDFRIIDRVVSPLLGKGSTYRVMRAELPVPIEYYNGFARWHRLSLMRAPKTLREIGEVMRGAAEPEKLARLLRVIEAEQGYELYQAVFGHQGGAVLGGPGGAAVRRRHVPGGGGDRPHRLRSVDRAGPRGDVGCGGPGVGAGRGHGRGPRVPDRRHVVCAGGAPAVRGPLRRRTGVGRRRVRVGRRGPGADRA